MSRLELFWLAPPTAHSRELDPLGLTTIYEAASNWLLPFLTGRTKHADEYLLTLVGLRWASETGGTDGDCWRRFERFEKGLKLAWGYLKGRSAGFPGVDAVRQMLDEQRFDLDFELIRQQRSQGLLGMYLTSLRAIGLVERDRLAPTTAGLTLVHGSRFVWDGEAGSTKFWLRRFSDIRFRQDRRRRLGKRLFGQPEMIAAASEVWKRGTKPAWGRASRALKGNQQAVAASADAFSRLATDALRAFYELLASPEKKAILRGVPVLPRLWYSAVLSDGLARLNAPFSAFVRNVRKDGRSALVTLHETLWEQRGHKAAWIRVGDGRFIVRRDTKWKIGTIPIRWDHRWTTCHQLIHQTRWSPT